MATPLVAGNWKMNTSVPEAAKLARELRAALQAVEGVTLVVCPPFVSLSVVALELGRSNIAVGAQNMHQALNGAYTGEISGPMLQGIGTYVILGHSERRRYQGEIDEEINLKTRAALELGLTPIICVGETLEERDARQADEVVGRQLTECLRDMTATDIGNAVIAYEPVWAIGTGRSATPETAQEMMLFIRQTVATLAGGSAANVPLLYGGSVTPGNAMELAAQPDLDGALVGGASLKVEEFAAIATAFSPPA
jgi:triosephosphate isomerase